jgi:CheY-like chemotaxis protein
MTQSPWSRVVRYAGQWCREELHPPVVLLVEDDEELRLLLGTVLRRDGYEVVEARDGTEALERIGGGALRSHDPHTPDVVISDIRMPRESGLELLAGLRRAGCATPVILMTGFGGPSTEAEARRLGAAAVFDKPFDIDDLRTALLNTIKA